MSILSGWSQSGKIRPGQTGSPSQGAVTLQAKFPMAGAYTVQFNVQDPNTGLAIGNRVLLRAEVIWSIEGNSVRRVADLSNGLSVSGIAQAVYARVFDESEGAAIKQDVTVSIQVTKGTRPSQNQPPTYSLEAVTLGPGAASEIIVIPEDIGAISVAVNVAPNTIGTAIGAYDILVQQAANISGSNILDRYDPRAAQWQPLRTGCRSLVISTSGAAPLLIATPTLGIDG